MVKQTQLFKLQSEARTQKFTFYSSLEKLNQACSSCDRCSLSQKRHQVVIGRGNTRPDIAIVGEAPGKQEDKLGQPFVGDSGKFLGTKSTAGKSIKVAKRRGCAGVASKKSNKR